MRNATAGVTMIPGITFAGTFEPDGTGTYQIIGGVTKADGLHIVRAVNAHDALVEALENAREFILRHDDADDDEIAASKAISDVLKLAKGE